MALFQWGLLLKLQKKTIHINIKILSMKEFYNFYDYAETWLYPRIAHISISDGYNGFMGYIILDDEMESFCKEHNIEMKYTINGCYSLGGGQYARVKEINDKNKEDNPLLCYVLEKAREIASKFNYKIESAELEKGWDYAQSDTLVYVNLDAITEHLTNAYVQSHEKRKREYEEQAALEKRKKAVKFKSDTDYELVKPI